MSKTEKRPVRSERVTVFLTPEVLDWYNNFAEAYGFKSRNEVMSYLLERGFETGMSPVGFLKTGFAIQNHCKAYNPAEFKQGGFDWKAPLLPPPPIPTEFLTDDQRKIVNKIETQLKGKIA